MEPSLPLATHTLKSSKLKNKVFIIFISMVLCTALLGLLQLKFLKPRYKDFYSFDVKDWRGRTMSLEKYRGKATLVVNVASYCQHTEKNYIMLQELQREFGSSHFTVLAFPCNQFGEMEPGLNDEIIYFAKSNYGVTFPIFSKIKILGSEASPAFKFLIGKVVSLLSCMLCLLVQCYFRQKNVQIKICWIGNSYLKNCFYYLNLFKYS
uniref:Glutathione peroxidase n=1 Tax=Laticauda laticaudata TaxID=8630 RepID=A0A8C5S4T5_LATLA